MVPGAGGFDLLVERVDWYAQPIVRPQCKVCGWVGAGCGDLPAWGLEAARHTRRCPLRVWAEAW